ncbi:MAG: hypothetical protein BWY63_02607 [Chloroflexi bacterium ADurb.Bin360]|nr:MAG: hypothetical protein BWY63_02607 [Chloroflexi bacterium ADurb.Bin360]
MLAYDRQGAFISSYTVASGGGGSLTTAWQQRSGTVTLPGNATTVRAELFDYMTDGWVAVDDVSLTGATVTKYYYLGSQRVAMRQGGVLTYLHGDHLGSASLATNASGAKVGEQRSPVFQAHLPYGGTRSGGMPTDRQFTGQRRESSLGFYDFVARQFDPTLGRFLQADTIVPNPANPQSLNRYSYTLGNPLKYVDYNGHNPFLAVLLGAGLAYMGGRVAGEIAVAKIPILDRYHRDNIGGTLVTNLSDVIQREAASHSVDPILIGAVLRLEGAATERRMLTLLPGAQPGLISNMAEGAQSILPESFSGSFIRFGDQASLGPAQMQLRRARELEEMGYVTPKRSDMARRAALLNGETSVEYVAGMLRYVSDQLQTIPGYTDLSSEMQQRLTLIAYNWGWTPDFTVEITKRGFWSMIEDSKCDNQTLDDFLRWRSQQ